MRNKLIITTIILSYLILIPIGVHCISKFLDQAFGKPKAAHEKTYNPCNSE